MTHVVPCVTALFRRTVSDPKRRGVRDAEEGLSHIFEPGPSEALLHPGAGETAVRFPEPEVRGGLPAVSHPTEDIHPAGGVLGGQPTMGFSIKVDAAVSFIELATTFAHRLDEPDSLNENLLCSERDAANPCVAELDQPLPDRGHVRG